MELSDLRIVMTTVASQADAERIAGALVERRAAACVNVIPSVTSWYWWEGRVQKDSEWILLVKTTVLHHNETLAAIRALHPYDLPELVTVDPASVSAEYRQWVNQSLL